jgi:hypothetical protein
LLRLPPLKKSLAKVADADLDVVSVVGLTFFPFLHFLLMQALPGEACSGRSGRAFSRGFNFFPLIHFYIFLMQALPGKACGGRPRRGCRRGFIHFSFFSVLI